MPDILITIARYGYVSLLRGAADGGDRTAHSRRLALLAAGAAAASGGLHPALAFGVAVGAMLIGDTTLYLAGRFSGWNCWVFCAGFL